MANEQRLIDANALARVAEKRCGVINIKHIDEAPTVDAVSRGVYDQVRWERDVAIEQLESYGVSLGEKADVVKVVHGRWKPVDHDGSWRVDMCSVCYRRMHYVDYDQPYQYCPNCGATMDGGIDNDI